MFFFLQPPKIVLTVTLEFFFDAVTNFMSKKIFELNSFSLS